MSNLSLFRLGKNLKLNKRDKILFSIFLVLFLISFFSFLSFTFWFETKEIKAKGGEYTEAIVGEMRIINPVLASSDAERAVIEILFDGLVDFDSQGNVILELAKDYSVSEDGKVYEFTLKDNIFWSDGMPITADDVVWTVKIMKDPAYRSYNLASWLAIGVEKVGERKVLFRLKEPYNSFLELASFKVLPKHIWENVPPQEFHLAEANLKPVSSGPYRVKKIEQDDLGFIKKIELEPNPYYYQEGPYLDQINLLFFKDFKSALSKALAGQVDGIGITEPVNVNLSFFERYKFEMPRYFALFMNTNSEVLSEVKVRKAIAKAVDREKILNKILEGKGKIFNSFLLPEFYGFELEVSPLIQDKVEAELLLTEAGFKLKEGNKFRIKEIIPKPDFVFTKDLELGSKGLEVRKLQECLAKDPEVYPEGEITGYFGQLTLKAVIRFQEKYREDILDPQNLKRGTGRVRAGTRAKLNQICFVKEPEKQELKVSLYTVNQPILELVAKSIREDLESVGFKVEFKALPLGDLLEKVKSRNFDLLLFGQILGLKLDLYPFWHSLQTKPGGLNITGLESKEVDQLIEKIRKTSNLEKVKTELQKLEDIFEEKTPALPLYLPEYSFYVNRKIKGIKGGKISDPSKRFWNIQEWYIYTKKVIR